MTDVACDLGYHSLASELHVPQSSYTTQDARTGVGFLCEYSLLPKSQSSSIGHFYERFSQNMYVHIPSEEYILSAAEDRALWEALAAGSKLIDEGTLID